MGSIKGSAGIICRSEEERERERERWREIDRCIVLYFETFYIGYIRALLHCIILCFPREGESRFFPRRHGADTTKADLRPSGCKAGGLTGCL